MFEYYHAPAPLLDDVLDELRESREMVAYLTRANETLTGQIERLERELSISRMAQVVMDNSVAEVERLTAQNMRLSGMCYDLMRVSPDPVPYAKRSPMEHERDEQ